MIAGGCGRYIGQRLLRRQTRYIGQLLDEIAKTVADERDVKVFLAFEIDVKRSLADLCGGGDVIEAHLVEWFGGRRAVRRCRRFFGAWFRWDAACYSVLIGKTDPSVL